MKQFLTVIAFSLLTIGMFTAFSNFGIPRIEPAPPPVQEEIDLGAMTMDSFIALGERLIPGKGTCTLCHNDLGRAPMLNEIVANTAKRFDDPRYEGEATDLGEYIYESMVDPSAYVVVGFGKAGSGDTVSPMPNVAAGSIGLSEAELLAIIAYLQDSSGVEITVEIPSDAADAQEEEDESGEPREPFETVQDIVDEFGCGACHIIGEDEGDMGPALNTIGGTHDAAYIRRGIIDPNAEIAEGFEEDLMPDDFGAQMYASELELLVNHLVESK